MLLYVVMGTRAISTTGGMEMFTSPIFLTNRDPDATAQLVRYPIPASHIDGLM